MSNDRNFILERLQSKKVSIEEFNYERLIAPPLAMFLSPADIYQLNSIAKSLKLSSKPEIRYQEIDKVMRNRGLVKFAAGTNRVVYRHPEFPEILFKVASDAVGLGDNPAEFVNQHLLKPFCCKCYEISPCGTVGIFERVNPIRSREEFISVADDVFELITEWLIGEYVLADIGTRYFMNFGIRKSFGVVLLDYPYVYKLDGNKLYCNKMDVMSPTGRCEGEIDYDASFSFLRCTKCGAIYKAKELEQKIKNDMILEKGETKMKVITRGGSKAVSKKVVNSNELGENKELGTFVKSTPSKPVVSGDRTRKINITNTANDIVKDNSNNICLKVKATKTENVKPATNKEVIKEVVIEEDKPVVSIADEERVPITVDKHVNGVGDKPVKSMVSFSEETKQEALAEKKEVTESPVEYVEKALKKIADKVNEIEIESVKDGLLKTMFDFVLAFMPVEKRALKLFDAITDDSDEIVALDNFHDLITTDEFIGLVSKFLEVKLESSKLSYPNTSDISLTVIPQIVSAKDKEVMINKCEEVELIIPDVFGPDEESAPVVDDDESDLINPEVDTDRNADDENVEEAPMSIKLYSAVMVDLAEIAAGTDSHKVIIPLAEDGTYMVAEDSIVAIDTINDESISETTLVSDEWLNSVLDSSDIEEEVEDEEATVVYSDDDSNSSVNDIPVGVLPPEDISNEKIGGMTAEEFIAQEEALEKEAEVSPEEE